MNTCFLFDQCILLCKRTLIRQLTNFRTFDQTIILCQYKKVSDTTKFYRYSMKKRFHFIIVTYKNFPDLITDYWKHWITKKMKTIAINLWVELIDSYVFKDKMKRRFCWIFRVFSLHSLPKLAFLKTCFPSMCFQII